MSVLFIVVAFDPNNGFVVVSPPAVYVDTKQYIQVEFEVDMTTPGSEEIRVSFADPQSGLAKDRAATLDISGVNRAPYFNQMRFEQFDPSSGGNAIHIDDFLVEFETLSLASAASGAVPEPGTASLLAIGAVCLWATPPRPALTGLSFPMEVVKPHRTLSICW